jgi:hypothetical protein
MKLIPLTRGLFAQVDDWNYEWLNHWRWYASRAEKKYYAARSRSLNEGKKKTILMHRQIMNTSDDMEVDHVNHDTLNCQEYNMRNCTGLQNKKNVLPRGKSKYLGVSFLKIPYKNRVYVYITARIKILSINKHLGTFQTEEAAARAYDDAARIHYGEFANLNFKL